LRGLVTTGQQYDDYAISHSEVDPIASTNVHAHFGDTITYRFDIAKITRRGTVNATSNSNLRPQVAN
jgi:hypothetical protein